MKELNDLLKELADDLYLDTAGNGKLMLDDEWLSYSKVSKNNHTIMFSYMDDAFGEPDQEVCYPLHSEPLTQKALIALLKQIKHKNAKSVVRLTFPSYYENIYSKLIELANDIERKI